MHELSLCNGTSWQKKRKKSWLFSYYSSSSTVVVFVSRTVPQRKAISSFASTPGSHSLVFLSCPQENRMCGLQLPLSKPALEGSGRGAKEGRLRKVGCHFKNWIWRGVWAHKKRVISEKKSKLFHFNLLAFQALCNYQVVKYDAFVTSVFFYFEQIILKLLCVTLKLLCYQGQKKCLQEFHHSN